MKTTTRLSLLAICLVLVLNACKKDEGTTYVVPTVTTGSISNVTKLSAIGSGNITSDGGIAVIYRGLCWAIHPAPSITDSLTIDGGGTGQYNSTMLSLKPGTKYYVRAYATNNSGTGYGNEVTFTTLPLTIGEDYGGGKVAYILTGSDPGYSIDAQHGLIAAAADLGPEKWGAYGNAHATSTAMGNGPENTENIVLNLGTGTYAAKMCSDLIVGIYSDWYLPTVDEMNKLYLNQGAIGGFSGAADYWTSSEFDNNRAWAFQFNIGTYSVFDKLTALKLFRPVRSF